MNIDILKKHKFQFINFSYVYYPDKGDTGRVQMNNDSHLIHICKGQVKLNMNGGYFTAKTGDVVAFPSFTPMTMERTDDFEMMNLHYNIWLNDGTLLEDIKRLPLVFTPPYFEWCHKKLLEIKEIILKKPSIRLPDGLAHEIVLRHFTENPVVNVETYGSDLRMQEVKKFLDAYGYMKFDSNELSSICQLSKSQMNRKFKEEFGISPQKYWEEQRAKNICMALKKSSASINEIADKWGFKNSGYFWRWFKKMTNCTPTQYRKHIKGK